ncbi:MAG: hypothetical protein A3G24_26905 [Betaproteobacteria bacterium RIFCSPLOWO2_12_FULL_62_13]|nr:MAG: hypothetical protein A3G24_26905 [Betaproteobacteria bacterium RIFCSPLOWO2_12_FULL_62_13]
MRTRFLVAGTIALVVAFAGTFAAFHLTRGQSSRPPPLPVLSDLGGEFELASAGGRVRLQDYRGRVVLLFFGYTYCPDVCPTSLHTLKLAVDTLGTEADRVQVIMITIDPERDSAQHLARYMRYFHPQFMGLSGTTDEVERVARQYRVFHEKVPISPGGYLVNHSGYFYLLDSRGRVRALFGAGAKPMTIADGVRQLLREN